MANPNTRATLSIVISSLCETPLSFSYSPGARVISSRRVLRSPADKSRILLDSEKLNFAMPPKIYIDGQAGTTALRIRDWLTGRKDLEVVTLPEELRKDPAARKKALMDASIVLLCLPDDAAKEAAAWLADSPMRILDASTAHRIADDWV